MNFRASQANGFVRSEEGNISVSGNYSASGTNKILAVLSLCTFFVGWDSLITVPLLPAMTGDTGIPADFGALLVSAYALAYLLSAPLFGAISDWVGRKRMIFSGMLVLGVGTALTGLGNSFSTLLLFRAVTGIGAGMIEPGVYALIGDRFPYERRGRAIGLVSGTLIASTLFGVPLGGYLAEISTWRYAFWIIGALALSASVAVYLALPNDRPEPDSRQGVADSALRSTLGQFRAAFSAASVLFALLATFLWFGSLQGTFANIGIYYSRYFDFTEAQNGLILMVAGLGSVIGGIAGGRLADRFGKRAVVGISSVIAAASVFALTSVFTGLLSAAVVVHVVWATAFASGFSALTALISELNPEVRGTVLALNTSFMFAGSMVFTAASAVLLRTGGFLLVGALSAVAALLVLPLTLYLIRERATGGDSTNAAEASPKQEQS